MVMQESDFWHQVINTISEGLFLVDRQGRISNVNKALCQLTGYSKEEILGQPCSIFQCDTCATMRDGSVENWCHLFDTVQVSKRRCTIRHKSGEVIPILKNASLLHCDPKDIELVMEAYFLWKPSQIYEKFSKKRPISTVWRNF